MGGGDLNSKKSWHPHTLKNQEQVWKAEQAKAQEEKKLSDLRKEIKEEKEREELTRIGRESGVLAGTRDGEKKLDWMYKNSHDLINRDEYLLGRKIDKSFEVLQAEERQKEKSNMVGVKKPLNHVEHECVPFSIRAYKNVQMTEQVDLQRKFMEDPLMLIKQREMESRRKILENPVKLKELHRMLKTDEKLQNVSKKSKKTKKSKKSKKKRKKRSKSSSSDSSSLSESQTNEESDSDLDSKLAKKLKGGILDEEDVLRKGLNLNKLLDSKYEKISLELDKAAGKTSKKRPRKIDPGEDSSDNNESSDNYKQVSRNRSRSRSKQYSRIEERSQSFSKHKDIRDSRNMQGNSRSSPRRSNNNRATGGRQLRRSRSTSKTREFQRSIMANKWYKDKNYDRRRSRSKSNTKEYERDRNMQNRRSRSGSILLKRQDNIRPNRLQSATRPTADKRRSRSLSRNRYWKFNNRRQSRSASRSRDNKHHKIDQFKSHKKTTGRYSKSRSRSPGFISNNRRPSTPPFGSKAKKIKSISRSPKGNSKRNRTKSPNISRTKGKSNKSYSRSRSPCSRHNTNWNSKQYRTAKSQSRSRSPQRTQKTFKKTSPKLTSNLTHRHTKLSEEEKQAKLREMMSNAEWREDERSQAVRKHREAYAREEQQHTSREFDKDFLNKEVKKAMANQTSVGSRLKANLNNIQRTSAAMNSNFARK